MALPLLLAALAALPAPSRETSGRQDAASGRPNFVIFLADDLGWGDLGCQGHPCIRTPNLDRFATEGMRFTQCYAASGVCSPSRSAILTGRTPYRNGVYRWIPEGHESHLRRSEITIARLLKQQGYATSHVGKWHLNGHFNDPAQPQPDDHGFDWWFATQNNAAPSHRNPRNFVRNGEEVGPLEGFSAPLVVDEAVEWLRRHRAADRPFLLTVWTHEPHLPIETDPRFQEPYVGLDDAGLRQHHGNVTQLDHAFGSLMHALDELGLRDDTLVFFTSDNGPEGRGDSGRTRGSTGGLRGRKRDVYEGGIRVPGLARWPGRIAAGSTSAEPVVGSDLFATLCAAAGAAPPGDRTIDGTSLLPAFRGEPLARKVPLYWRCRIAGGGVKVAIRAEDWKILAAEDLSRFELYHLGRDPRETTDLAAAEPERLAELSARLIELQTDIEREGPDWWRTLEQPPPPPPLEPGLDETGDFDEVLGATVQRLETGYRIASRREGYALHRLEQPLQGRVVFELHYRTLEDQGTRNAAFVLGSAPDHEATLKCGTGIGMGAHLMFRGSWRDLEGGRKVPVELDVAATFQVRVTVDTEAGVVVAEIDGTEMELPLPPDLGPIRYFGYYVKETESLFGPIRWRTIDGPPAR